MVDEAVVRDRLATLRLNARRLASIAAAGRERFLADEDLSLKPSDASSSACVDHGQLFDNLTAGLPDFDAFAVVVEQFLGSHER
jgi:hypothetical protein